MNNSEQNAELLPSASVEANLMLSAALSVEEGNRAIAEFMGASRLGNGYEYTISPLSKRDNKIFHNDDLEYHSSWNWLKPAIDAFINLDISAFNYNAVTMSEFRRVRQSLSNMPISKSIDDFFNELVTAIIWYNSAVPVGSR